MGSDHVTGRTIVSTEWVGVPESAHTVITHHAVRADQANPRHLAVCGTFLADISQGRPWDSQADDACADCVDQIRDRA